MADPRTVDAPARPAHAVPADVEDESRDGAFPSSRPRVDFRIPFGAGMLVTLIGAFWDAWRHLNGLATSESLRNPFVNPAHGMIYGGATIMAASLVLL